ncbi:ATP dependent DNA ligase domain-containing protein [Mycotypha africana]|uniref:ATP dependent DNA ligase domain-containing protein n=1 Tax=Mycotypha africana TaxID=64632 RepID=UPI002301F5E4|nr:ATP dependent DNA ligase domain-containing protein [Mycotypha africana]KAI8981907.1 ATP dependent DNA ligase domain-containing protein [Mycotypha africana]
MSTPSPSFDEFCTLLERLSKAKSSEKYDLLQRYRKSWINNYGTDMYDAVRLLFPRGDDERKYNLKEDRLASLLVKALNIDPNSIDGTRLRKYKVPSAHNRTPGDFNTIAREEIKKRSTVRSSTMTVRDVNKYLDALSEKYRAQDDQLTIIRNMLRYFTARQLDWIIRIILKDLKIHCGEKVILNAIRPGSYDTWVTNNSLREISQLGSFMTESDAMSRGGHRHELRLFDKFLPQLAAQYADDLLEKFNKPFFIEKKIDGERVLMHYDKTIDRFLWHSRKRLEENFLYGSTAKDMTKLAGHICDGLLIKQNIILDGEMVGYHPEQGIHLPFGTLKEAARNDLTNTALPHPSYIVFDILMIDNTPLINFSFEDRLKVLEQHIQPQGKYMEFIDRRKISTKEELLQQLDEVIQKREEGLVLKDTKSIYRIDKRSQGWIKLKPVYMDAIVEVCDLLLVGATYGHGRRGGKYGSLLCAVRDDRIPETDPPRFVTFTLAGGGLREEVYRELDHLIKSATKHDPKNIPEWLIHPIRGGEPFSILIDYQDSIVVEVRGVEIVPSQKFGMELTLRFPTFLKIRPDKGWNDVWTYSGVIDAKTHGGMGRRRSTEDHDGAKRIKRTRGTNLLESQKGIDTSDVEVEGNIFNDKVFYVITGTKQNENESGGYTKYDLCKKIRAFGGRFILKATPDAMLIAGIKNREVQGYIEIRRTQDIVKPSYIIECIEKKRLLPLEPKHMLYISPRTKEEFSRTRDEYGDSYATKIREGELQEIMNRMDEKDMDDSVSRNLALETIHRYFPEGLPGMLFIRSLAYFDFDTTIPSNHLSPITFEWVTWKRSKEVMELYKARFEFQGGRIAAAVSDPNITHIIVNKDDLTRIEQLGKIFMREPLPRFVTFQWIDDCLTEGTLLDEERKHLFLQIYPFTANT